jgi:hypothetical protein
VHVRERGEILKNTCKKSWFLLLVKLVVPKCVTPRGPILMEYEVSEYED